jgi:hypothetical protein
VPMKKHKPEQIVALLQQVGSWKFANGKTTPQPARKQRSRFFLSVSAFGTICRPLPSAPLWCSRNVAPVGYPGLAVPPPVIGFVADINARGIGMYRLQTELIAPDATHRVPPLLRFISCHLPCIGRYLAFMVTSPR